MQEKGIAETCEVLNCKVIITLPGKISAKWNWTTPMAIEFENKTQTL